MLSYIMNYLTNLKRSGDNVYYNIVITNNTNDSQLAQFQETRSDNIVDYMEDFHMAVIRFGIPTQDIPIMNNFATNIYSLMIAGTGATGGRNVPFTGGATSQQFLPYFPVDNSGQNYMLTYNAFCYSINTAFFNAVSAIGGITGSTGSQVPFMTFNSTNQLFSIYVPLNVQWKIYFNEALYNLFPSFPYLYFNTDAFSNANLGAFAQFPTIGGTNVSDVSGFIEVIQETASTISLWDARSIRFATNAPIRSEFLPYSGSSQSNSASNSTMSVLTDFDLPLDAISQIRPYAQFFPQGPYRLIDITGNGPLRTFNLTLYVVDQLENLTPLYIPSGQSMSIKILFQNKTLSKKYF